MTEGLDVITVVSALLVVNTGTLVVVSTNAVVDTVVCAVVTSLGGFVVVNFVVRPVIVVSTGLTVVSPVVLKGKPVIAVVIEGLDVTTVVSTLLVVNTGTLVVVSNTTVVNSVVGGSVLVIAFIEVVPSEADVGETVVFSIDGFVI